MRLGQRLFLVTSLIVAGTVTAVIVLAEAVMRRQMEAEVAAALEREARLIARLVPPDSSRWPEVARELGTLTGHRVTLVGSDGRVRGDTEFDRRSLRRLENHLGRPEIQQALASGVGRATRRSASTNERQMYVALRLGTPGLAAVRVSAELAAVQEQVRAVQRAVAWAGLAAVLAAALLAAITSSALARPLVQLARAARELAAGRAASFPVSRIPEIAEHITSLRLLAGELADRVSELRRERAEMSRLIEALRDGVLAADREGRITAMNTAARSLLGYADHQDVPPLAQLFHQLEARQLVEEIMAGRECEERELSIGTRTVAVAGRPLPEGGSLLVLRDVTALKRLEAVRRDFVANVSHELKTPLTSIAGYAETLVQETPPGPAHEFAATILKNARRMQQLVDDLLDLSRIESGGWQPKPEVLAIAQVAPAAWEPFRDTASARGIRFEVEAGPATVYSDPGALHQILTNLFDNAVRHAPGGRIAVRAHALAGGTTIEVADTGSGIPPEHLPRIFERFYRVDPARSREAGGTGLGLAIVKHLVEAHGGKVEAESAPGRGTVIRLWFPGPPATA
jgi:signal transduction histidine kinase